MLFQENQGQPETPYPHPFPLHHHLNLTGKQCRRCAVGAGSCQNVLTKQPHALQPCSPPRQRELSLNYTKQIGSINFFFPPLNGDIKIKMNGNCFSIRGDGRHGAQPLPLQDRTPCFKGSGSSTAPTPPPPGSLPNCDGAWLGRESPTAPTERGTGLQWERGCSTQMLPPRRGHSSPRRIHQAHFRELLV